MENLNVKKFKKGFTLTELIIVIVIIGILAAVLIPSLSSYIKKAKKSAAEQDALGIYKEFLQSVLDVSSEDYGTLSELNYVVECDKHQVIIQKGSVKGSIAFGDTSSYSIIKSSNNIKLKTASTTGKMVFDENTIENFKASITDNQPSTPNFIYIKDNDKYTIDASLSAASVSSK